MKYITAKQMLLPTGWKNDQQVGVLPDGTIGYVGPIVSQQTARVALLLPAQVNVHSHSFQRAMSGQTEMRGPIAGDSFWTWRKLMYRFLDHLSPDHVEAIAKLVFMEMLEAGYASVVEFHYLHHGVRGVPYQNRAELCERIVAAAQSVGIGLTLLPVLYQYGGCDGRPLAGGQQRFHNTSDTYEMLFEAAKTAVGQGCDDFNLGVAPHSLRAVDHAGLALLSELYPDGPVHMHLGEQLAEVEEVQEHLGARPVNWLLDNHDVDPRWCLIHCTQMTPRETSALAKTGAVAGLCPITESNLGDGIFDGVSYLNDKGRFGIGSDSNVHISLFDELKTLEYSQRLRDHSRAALASTGQSTGRVLYGNSLAGGAQASQRNSGQIAVGMLADMTGIETNNQWLCDRYGDVVLDSLIFGGQGQRCITDVWSAGRHVVKQGQHSQRGAIVRSYQKALAQLPADI
ncbi:MAG: formimidoylglutamate deiminase [Paracoccaceae bacterium]